MASGIAHRRQARAARRKKLLAERRAFAEPGATLSLARRMQHLARAPLGACLVQDGMFERGNGIVILTRKTGPHEVAMAAFLLDAFCRGVKDTVLLQADERQIDEYIAMIAETAPLAPVDPSYARKLLRDLVTYTRALGIEPHGDYAALELLFGDCSPEACDVTFRFGCEGKPLYIPGPGDTPAQIRQLIKQLRRRLGDGDFFQLPDDDPFEAPDIPGYDPAEAPDPVEWLALDEDERLGRVLDHHESAGISAPDNKAHAHAILHVVVENQIALGDELPVRRAVERLVAGGLERHEALHAVAALLVEHMHDVAQGEATTQELGDAYNAAVERLTVESWRAWWKDEDGKAAAP